MRDLAVREPRQPVQAKVDIDLNFLNDGPLDLQKFQEMIEKVDLPTEKIISPTLTTGENTRLWVSVLLKALQYVQSMRTGCQNKMTELSAELSELYAAFRESKKEEGDEENARMLTVVLIAEVSKSQAYQSYDKIIEAHQSALHALTQVLFPLLKLQKSAGPEIKKNPNHIEYLARTYREIDREWSNVRKAYVLMQKESPQIENMENWQGCLQSANGTIGELQTVREYRLKLGLAV